MHEKYDQCYVQMLNKLTIFHEGKLSKYSSNELMKNGWKSVRYNGRLLIELDCQQIVKISLVDIALEKIEAFDKR